MSVFSVVMSNQTIIASADLVNIHTDSTLATGGSNIRLLRAWCSQGATETSEQLGIQICIQASTFGTFTSTPPQPMFLGGRVSGIIGGTAGAEGTAGTDASTNGAGTKTTLIADGFNNLNGWLWVPTPEERIVIPADTSVTLAMIGTATTLTNWYAGIIYEELN